MRYLLVNPPWSFDGSIYFGCREPHLPLEFGSAKVLLEQAGHEVEILDGHMFGLNRDALAATAKEYAPDILVVTTAPTYLFWRCAPPELRVPQELLEAVADVNALKVAVGPHASTTPRAAMTKLGVDVAILGECEEALVEIASGNIENMPGTAVRRDGEVRVNGGPRATRFRNLPPLRWDSRWIDRHAHHHHRFDAAPHGPGAEVESSRGCPYHCSFCAKENFRDVYRRRDLEPLLAEIDALIAQGVEYIYFVDEIFLPNVALLQALATRNVKFGVQTRIDLWKPSTIQLLGEAGCVSVEAGVESLTPEGRNALDKKCRLSTDELSELLILAKERIPFVQANLIKMPDDDAERVAAWRSRVRDLGIWANDPVPLFPYPGSPDYRKMWGLPDDDAWERAVDYYLAQYTRFSDVQQDGPQPLHCLERHSA